jgi:uncharacterized protein (TIGR02996 family)
MADDAAFLAAIDADPDNDAPRLAHADWLEQNGHLERARFIRRQVAGQPADSRPWTEGLPLVRGMSWHCRRGYPEVVRFESLKAFKEGWPLTAGRHVRHVEFFGLRAAKLADEPALAAITSLEFSITDPAVILAVLRSPRLGPLRHLDVAPRPADHGFLSSLASVPALAGLRSLQIEVYTAEPVEEGPVAALGDSPHLSGLRSLRIKAWLDEGAMRVLWRPGSLAGLTSLELATPGIRFYASCQAGLDDLGDGAAMPALERFVFARPHHLSMHKGGDAALAVARAVCWTGLRVLDLSGANVSDAGVVALAEAPHLSRLARLSLAGCRMSDAGAEALATSPHLRSLASLDLTSNVIGRAGAAAFGRSMSLPRLRSLSLADNPAPAGLIEAVEARFRDGGPPVEEAAPAPLPAVARPPVPQLGQAEEDGLVRAIWADPFDEVPRLVYADWLDEQGKPLQAAILRAAPAEREEPANRLAALMHEDAPCKLKVALTEDGLVRGIISARALRSKPFERDGPAWLRRHHVAEVILEGKTSDMGALFAADWLANTRGLSFGGREFNAWEALAGSPRLAALGSLDVVGNYMQMADKMFGGSGLHGLRGLCRLLVGNFLHPDGVRAVCEAPFAPTSAISASADCTMLFRGCLS